MISIVTAVLLVCVGLCSGQESPSAIVVHPPTYSSASTGQTVRMTCAAYGNPTPSITWSRASISLSSKLSDSNSGYKKYDQTVTVNGTDFMVSVLEICDVTILDTDEFMCTAVDNGIGGVGVASPQAKFYLSVTGAASEPPAVIVRPPAEGATVDEGNTIEAVCVAYGNPLPTITWTKDGCTDISCSSNAKIFSEVVTYGDVSFRKSILQLCNVQPSNGGSFTCSAMNGIGGEGVAPKSFSWQLAVVAKPVSVSSSSVSKVIPTTSCPKQMTVTSTVMRGGSSTAPSGSVRVQGSTGSEDNSGTYVAIIAILGVVVAVLLVFVVIVIIFAVRARRTPLQKAEIAVPPKDPRVYAVENPIHQEQEQGGEDDLDEQKDQDTMTYADLAKKMEAEADN